MDHADQIGRFAASRVARLATVRSDGHPHLLPVVFVLVADTIYTAVDNKPKRTRRLQRLANIRSEPRCSVLVDHYDDDWSRLWWVRADGFAMIMDPSGARDALTALAAKYPQYNADPPPGPLIAVRVSRWTGWAASTRTVDSPGRRSGSARASPPESGVSPSPA